MQSKIENSMSRSVFGGIEVLWAVDDGQSEKGAIHVGNHPEHFPGTARGMEESVVNQDRQGPCPHSAQNRGVSELVDKPVSIGHQTTKEVRPGDEMEWDREAGYSQQGWPPRAQCDLVLGDATSWAIKEKGEEVGKSTELGLPWWSSC